MTKTDQIFLKHFAQLVAGLMLFTLILIVIAVRANEAFYNGTPADGSVNALAQERQEAARRDALARITPFAQVYHGETGRQAMLAAEEAARAAAKAQVAYGGTLDGGVIYGQLCKACHDTGAGGSPLLVRAQWEARIAQGVDTMVKHAIEGFQGNAGLMPARGGNPSLTDEQVRVTVEYMLNNLK